MDAIGAYDLTKVYGPGGGRPALHGVNLLVPEGRSMACVGPYPAPLRAPAAQLRGVQRAGAVPGL